MGLMDKMRESRERKAEAKRQADHDRRVKQASQELRELHEALEAARLPDGTSSADGVMLKPGEVAYLIVEGAAFVEPKRAPGQWKGGSQGASFRIAKGVSYRVGGTRGTFQQGEERPTPTDMGTFVLTDRRCLFVGSKRTTEWAFSKLMAYDTDGPGTAFFNVSNRQKTTGVMFGSDVENQVDAMIAGAIARFSGEEVHARLVAAMTSEYEYAYRCFEALKAGEEPPERAPEELPPPVASSEPSNSAVTAGRPTTEGVTEILASAGFVAADDSEGFGVRDEGDRLKVFWVKSNSSGRDEMVPEMAKALRDAGHKARVARQDGYPYVSVTA